MTTVVNLIIIVLVAVIMPKTLADGNDSFDEIRERCQQQFNITYAEFEAVQEMTSEEDVDVKFKCFAHCLAKEMDALDEAGKMDVEKLETLYGLDKETADKITDCKAEHDKNDDECEYSFDMLSCIFEHMAK